MTTLNESYLGPDFHMGEVLFSHDGVPIMFYCTDVKAGVVYLASAIEETETSWIYLLGPLQGGMEDPVVLGTADIRDAFQPPRTETVEKMVLTWIVKDDETVEKTIERTTVDASTLTNAELAFPGARLKPKKA